VLPVRRRISMRKERSEKTARMLEVDGENEMNSQKYRSLEDDITSKENLVGTDMPNFTASVSQLGGEVLGEEMICERSQENKDEEIIHAQHQGILFLPNNDGLAPGSA
jgi:hypothetical protein